MLKNALSSNIKDSERKLYPNRHNLPCTMLASLTWSVLEGGTATGWFIVLQLFIVQSFIAKDDTWLLFGHVGDPSTLGVKSGSLEEGCGLLWAD